jgi:hypothetical protein
MPYYKVFTREPDSRCLLSTSASPPMKYWPNRWTSAKKESKGSGGGIIVCEDINNLNDLCIGSGRRLISVYEVEVKGLFYTKITLPGYAGCIEYDGPSRLSINTDMCYRLARAPWILVPTVSQMGPFYCLAAECVRPVRSVTKESRAIVIDDDDSDFPYLIVYGSN